jgi:hypothetical protein
MRDNKFKKVLILVILLLFISSFKINDSDICGSKIGRTLPQGDPYFIMLSDYTDGAGDDNLWAVQLRFDISLGIVESEFDNKSLPLITDKWVEIRIEIDLNNDWMEIYYNNELLHEKEWSAGPENTGNGIVNISAVNLFSDSQTSIYFDDFTLEEVGGGVIWSDSFDTYEDGSSIHGQGGWKGWDNNPIFTAYVSSFQNRSFPHSLEISYGSDVIREYFGNYSGEFVHTAWIYFPENIEPNPPEISGPVSGGVNKSYEYTFFSTDPNLDDLWYYVDWDDGNFEEWAGPFESGSDVIFSHSWSENGSYNIRAKARDALEFESDWSEPFNVIISNPPDKPDIEGPTSVRVNVEQEFTVVSIDPDDDDIKYYIDWGDNSTLETDYFPSGTKVYIKHTWTEKDNYSIKAKAIDSFNAESNSSKFEIIVPKYIETNFKFLRILSEFFPNCYKIFKYLILLSYL